MNIRRSGPSLHLITQPAHAALAETLLARRHPAPTAPDGADGPEEAPR